MKTTQERDYTVDLQMRNNLLLNALEDIVGVTARRGTVVDSAVKLNNMVLKIEAIAASALKVLERGV